jgi:hypothetical protein
MGRGLRFLSGCVGIAPILALITVAPVQGFVPEERWGATASGPASAVGRPVTLSWSIVPDGTLIQGEGSSGLIAFLDGVFGSGPGGSDLTQRPWFSHLSGSFDRWSQVSGMTFQFEPHDDSQIHGTAGGISGVRGDIRLGGAFIDGGSGTLAYSYFPNNSDMVIDTGDTSFFSNSSSNYRAFRNTFMHELGHGIGLDHVVSNTDAFLMEPTITISYDGPQLDDIRGAHWYYGDALEKSNGGTGNETVASATSLGMIPFNATASVGGDAAPDTAVQFTEVDFVSIANSVDADFYSFDVGGPAGLNAVLTPRGGVFNQAAQGQTQSQFDANARSNLALAIFDRDGDSLLALADYAAEGAVESFTGLRLPSAGRYFARVTGSSEIVQLYQLDLSTVALAATLPGDFNFDGEVGAADYVVWRQSVGETGLALAADANQDQIVDDADYRVWRANFGAVAGSSTALFYSSVPEPTSITLAGLAFLGCLSRRRRPNHRKRCLHIER